MLLLLSLPVLPYVLSPPPPPGAFSGFTDMQTLQNDPDLRPLQGPELSALINK